MDGNLAFAADQERSSCFIKNSVGRGHQVYAHAKLLAFANSQNVSLKFKKVWSEMSKYSILDYWILALLTVAFCFNQMCVKTAYKSISLNVGVATFGPPCSE